MPRVVEPETLDHLAETDPDAMRSRRDLRRVHRFMGTRGIVAAALRSVPPPSDRPVRVLELGAGDGTLLLGVAGALRRTWPSVDLTLLDRQTLVDPATVAGYRERGWTVAPLVTDVGDWVATDDGVRYDAIVTNLFLHHFEAPALGALLRAVAGRTRYFFACEPRRAAIGVVGSRLMGLIGANAVTRADALISVHAGFRDAELGALWPLSPTSGWTVDEYAAGLFSHCFAARRTDR